MVLFSCVSHTPAYCLVLSVFSPIIACIQLRTNTGKKPWYEAVPVQSMMLESLGVLSRWTIEVKVRKDAALISWRAKKTENENRVKASKIHLMPFYTFNATVAQAVSVMSD